MEIRVRIQAGEIELKENFMIKEPERPFLGFQTTFIGFSSNKFPGVKFFLKF
jgi:hypothetical protein